MKTEQRTEQIPQAAGTAATRFAWDVFVLCGDHSMADEAKRGRKKPMVGFIAGVTAPPGRRMGHAGAIISSAGESAAEKVAMLRDLGVTICPTPAAMGTTVAEVLGRLT